MFLCLFIYFFWFRGRGRVGYLSGKGGWGERCGLIQMNG